MLRTSLYFTALACAALLLSDISISTLNPWQELGRMGWGMLTPFSISIQIFSGPSLIPSALR